MESVSLLWSFGHRTPQPRIFRLPQYFMRGLPFHRPFHHNMPLRQPIHSSLPRTIKAQIHQLHPMLSKHLNQSFSLPLTPTAAPHLPPAAKRQRCQYMHIYMHIFVAVLTPASFAQFKKLQIKKINYLLTPVNVSSLSFELLHYPDPNFSEYLLLGLSHGFHPGVDNLPSENLICPIL